MDEVYILYLVHGNNGIARFQELSIFKSVERAQMFAGIITDVANNHGKLPGESKFKIEPAHESMNEDNNYVYVGMQEDLTKPVFDPFCGYLIEKREVM